MEAALELLKSLKLGGKLNYTQVAKNFGVKRSTLSRRHRGVQGSYAEKVDNSRLLSATQESELIKYLDNLCAKGLPSSRQMVRSRISRERTRQELGWVTVLETDGTQQN